MTLALPLAGLVLLPQFAQSPCPATAADAISDLGASIHEHTFPGAPLAPGLAVSRTFHRPSLTVLGEQVEYAWVSRNHAGLPTEIIYRLGSSFWTSTRLEAPLATRVRDALPDAECSSTGCFRTVQGGGANVGDLEMMAVTPVAAVRGGEELAAVADDIAAINLNAAIYPVVLRCSYSFVAARTPVPHVP